MLEKDDFQASTRRLRKQVDAAARSSMDELLGYCDTFGVSRKSYHQALLLKPRFDIHSTDSDRAGLRAEMTNLIDEVVSDREAASGATLARQDARKKYLESQRDVDIERNVVFESEGIGYQYSDDGFRLEGVSVKLRLGEITGIVGENANGKTTLFRLIVGELRHHDGTLCYPDLGSSDPDDIDWTQVKRQIAYVPQQLDGWYGTIEENLRYAAASRDITGIRNDWELQYIAERLGITDFLGMRWSELSGGFKLRCALARALIWKPKFLVLDEPLANLDFRSQLTLLRDVRDLANSFSNPIAVALSSQHLHEVEAVADRILFLSNGKVLYYGDRSKLGTERKENTYELGSELDLTMLRNQFQAEGIRRIVFDGISYIITTDREVGSDHFLRLLIRNNISIRYFRDISTSVKQLFERNETDA